jgi:hypothetical protein
MTLLAQALKRAKPEFIDVAMVRLDMITDGRWRDDAALQATIKRVFEQLVLPDPYPASRGVPLVCRSPVDHETDRAIHARDRLDLVWVAARSRLRARVI